MRTRSSGQSTICPPLLELFLLLALTFNTFVGGTTYGLYMFWPRLVTYAINLTIIAVWLSVLHKKKRPFPQTILDLPLAGLGFVFLFSLLFSIEPRLSLEDVPMFFFYGMVYYMAIDFTRAYSSIDPFFKAIAMVTIMVGLIALLEMGAWYFGLPMGETFSQGWWSIGGLDRPIPPQAYRLKFTLNNANILSGYLVVVIPVGIGAALVTRSRWTRLNALAWLTVIFSVLVLSVSRGAWLGVGVSLLFAAAALILDAWKRQKKQRRAPEDGSKHGPFLLRMGGVLLVFLILTIALWPTIQKAVTTRFQSLDIRLALWHYALQTIYRRPLVGSGPRTFGLDVMRLWEPEKYPPQFIYNTAHNIYLHTAAEVGLPGLLLILIIAGYLLKRWWQVVPTLDRRQFILSTMTMTGIVGFATHGLVDNLLAVPSVVVPFIIMVASLVHFLTPPRALAAAHRWMTPIKSLLLTLAVAIICGWLLYGQRAMTVIAGWGSVQQWEKAADSLDRLEALDVIPYSYYGFQRGGIDAHLAAREVAHSERAIDSLTHALAQMPYEPSARAVLATMYEQTGDLDQASAQWEMAAKQWPTNRLLAVNWGSFFERTGQEQKAIETYARLLSNWPELAGSSFWDANVWRRQNWPAITQESKKTSVEAYHQARMEYYQGNWTLAERLINQYQSEQPLNQDASIWQVKILAAQDRWSEVKAVLSEWQTHHSEAITNADWLLLKGRLALTEGNLEQAETYLREAAYRGTAPDVPALFYLSQIELTRGNWQEAVKMLESSLWTSPGDQHFVSIAYRQPGISGQELLPVPYIYPTNNLKPVYCLLLQVLTDHRQTEAIDELREHINRIDIEGTLLGGNSR